MIIRSSPVNLVLLNLKNKDSGNHNKILPHENNEECSMKFKNITPDIHHSNSIGSNSNTQNLLLTASSLDSNNSSSSSQCGGGNLLTYSDVQNDYYENSSLSDTQFVSLSPFGENLFAYEFSNDVTTSTPTPQKSSLSSVVNSSTKSHLSWNLCDTDYSLLGNTNVSSNTNSNLYSQGYLIQPHQNPSNESGQNHHDNNNVESFKQISLNNDNKILGNLITAQNHHNQSSSFTQQPSHLLPFMNNKSTVDNCENVYNLQQPCDNRICKAEQPDEIISQNDHYLAPLVSSNNTDMTTLNQHRAQSYPATSGYMSSNGNSAFSLINEINLDPEEVSFIQDYDELSNSGTIQTSNGISNNNTVTSSFPNNSIDNNDPSSSASNYINRHPEDNSTIVKGQYGLGNYDHCENPMNFLINGHHQSLMMASDSTTPTINLMSITSTNTNNNINNNSTENNTWTSLQPTTKYNTNSFSRTRRKPANTSKSNTASSKGHEETPQERDKRVRNNEASRRSRAAKKMRVEAIVSETEMLNIENRKLKVILEEIVSAICDAKELLIKNYKTQQ